MAKIAIKDLRARIDEAATQSWRALGDARSQSPPALFLPDAFAEVLLRACALEDIDGGDLERAGRLLDHYLSWMPARRVEQLCATEGIAARIFHAPLDWDAMPRLSGALKSAFDLLDAAEVHPLEPLGAPDPDTFMASSPTLAALYQRTFFGGFMPMLGASPVDLNALTDEIDEIGLTPTIDRRMTAPLVHEWMHFGRNRRPLLPPYLDECVAGFLGLVVHEGTAFPPPGEDTGLYGAPWLAQVGAALGRTVGLKALVRAQAGADAWRDAMPPGLLDACERLGWARIEATRQAHFLPDTTNPWPWVRLFLRAGAGEDVGAITWETLCNDGGHCGGLSGDAIRKPGGDPGDTMAGHRSGASVGECLDDPGAGGLTGEPARSGAFGETAPNPLDSLIISWALWTMTLSARQTPSGAFRISRRLPVGSVILDAELGRCHLRRDPGMTGLGEVEIAPPAFFLPPSSCERLRLRGMARVAVVLHDLGCIPYLVDALLEGGLCPGSGVGFEVAVIEGGEG